MQRGFSSEPRWTPNHTLHLPRPSHRGCNRRASWAPSLNLGRWAASHAMHSRYAFIFIAVYVFLTSGCQHPSPPVSVSIDRTGWVEVARGLTPWSCRKMLRVMRSEGIPAWIDGAGYPRYPLKVPPEHRDRATTLIRQHGYDVFVSE